MAPFVGAALPGYHPHELVFFDGINFCIDEKYAQPLCGLGIRISDLSFKRFSVMDEFIFCASMREAMDADFAV